MALLHLEGFDALLDFNRIGRFYESFSGSNFGSQNGMHNGSSAASLCASGSDQVLRTRSLVAVDQDTWIVGFGFRPNNTTAVSDSSFPYVAIRNDDGEQIRLELFTNNPTNAKPGGTYYSLRVVRGATVLASTNERFPIGGGGNDSNLGWIYFQWKVVINNTTGSFELRYDKRAGHTGEQTATWDAASSGLDTQNQTSADGNRMELSYVTGNPSRTVAFDDIYVCDDTGSVNNDFLGRVAIVTQKPASPGPGDTDEWVLAGGAGNLNAAWDEVANGGDDDARVTSKNTNDITLAQVDPLAFLRDVTIHGVSQRLTCKMETTGSLTLHHRWRKTTGTPAEVDGGSFVVNSTTYYGDSDIQETDPNTALPWVIADIDSYQHGVRNGG